MTPDYAYRRLNTVKGNPEKEAPGRPAKAQDSLDLPGRNSLQVCGRSVGQTVYPA